ncbi:MAG: AmmeMemoRadiSam system protein A [Phycisphaerae bacterium]
MSGKSSVIESAEDRRRLLRLAREAARRKLGAAGDELMEKPDIKGWFGGAFVTFWAGKRLRGCVGTFVPSTDIAATIQEVTQASLNDERFASNPITADELKDLEIEISILSDLGATTDPVSLVPGTHGIVVRRGGRSGCFLPKVATDRSWSSREFLSNCCTMKAGLPADAWRSPDAEVLLFTADVFCESEFT